MAAPESMPFGLPDHAVRQLGELFGGDPRIQAVWLYGSRALGRERPGSDIDLCIEGPVLGLDDLYALENRIDDLLLPWKVDLSLMHKIDNPALLDHIRRVGLDLLKLRNGPAIQHGS